MRLANFQKKENVSKEFTSSDSFVSTMVSIMRFL